MKRKTSRARDLDEEPVDWDWLFQCLLVRSGQRCEVRSPDCLGLRNGYIGHLARSSVSIHHRRPRRMGGTRRPDTNTLPNLMLLCGSGTVGCHGLVESERTVALERGVLLYDGQDPAVEPVTMPGGRKVLLDPSGLYLDVSDPPTFDVNVPGWSRAA